MPPRPILKKLSWKDPSPPPASGGAYDYILKPIDRDDFIASLQAEAAKRFFCKALASTTRSVFQECPVTEQAVSPTSGADSHTTISAPRVMNVDKNAAYPKAIAEMKAAGALPQQVELRQVKYLNNLIEQDHRFIKRLVKPGMGFFSFETAQKTLQGYEVMNMIRKGQVQEVAKGDIRRQVALVAKLFGVAI